MVNLPFFRWCSLLVFSREDALVKVPGAAARLDRMGNDFTYKPLPRIARQAQVHLGLTAERSGATKALPIHSSPQRTGKFESQT